MPEIASLQETVTAFKRSLEVTSDKAREIERDTCEQQKSVVQYRITASMFSAVLCRRPDTPPDSLVLRIIQPKTFSTEATKYGIENEASAVKEYVTYQHSHGHPELVVSASGFITHTAHSFLGASPDGAVYNPSNQTQPFGFIEVNCPYSVKNISPTEACTTSGFCCALDTTGQLRLKENHQYYVQVQGLLGNDHGVTSFSP